MKGTIWGYSQCYFIVHISGFLGFFLHCIPICNHFLCTKTSMLPSFSHKALHFLAISLDSGSWRRIYTKTHNIWKPYTPCLLFSICQQDQRPAWLRFFALKPTIMLSMYSDGFPPNSPVTEENISATLSLHFSNHCCYWLKPLTELLSALGAHTQLLPVSCTHSWTGRYGKELEPQPPVTACFNNWGWLYFLWKYKFLVMVYHQNIPGI